MQKRNKERNIFTLSEIAQSKVNKLPKGSKSKYVSDAIEHFTPIAKNNKFHENN